MPRRVGVRSPLGAARLPPRADPGPAGVPGSARAAGGLRPKDPAEEPAEPGPGGLARRAQPLAHGPGAGAARKAPRAAPRRLLCSRRTPQPPPRGGASRKSGGTWLHPRLVPGQSVVLGSPFPVEHSWHPQGSLPFECLWAFSRLRTKGKYG